MSGRGFIKGYHLFKAFYAITMESLNSFLFYETRFILLLGGAFKFCALAVNTNREQVVEFRILDALNINFWRVHKGPP